MFSCFGSFWGLVCRYWCSVFGFITSYTLLRYHWYENYMQTDSDCVVVHGRKDDQLGLDEYEESGFDLGSNDHEESGFDLGSNDHEESGFDLGSNDHEESGFEGFGEEEESVLVFRFERFKIEECIKNSEETEEKEDSVFIQTEEKKDSVFTEDVSNLNTSKYLFMSGNDICGFIEDPETMKITSHEVFLDSNDDSTVKNTILDSGFSTSNRELVLREAEDVHEEKTEDSAEITDREEVLEKAIKTPEVSDNGEIDEFGDNSLTDHALSDVFQSEKHMFFFNFDSTSISPLAENQLFDTRVEDQEFVSEDEFIVLELNSGVSNQGVFSQDIGKSEDKHESEESVLDVTEKSEESSLEEETSSDSDDELGFEFLHEQQDLINQMKMEMKQGKNRGLPTILEESESPKMAEDLKPLKIDQIKVEHKDRLEEIQKFYKSYAEKMRKLDILNNQAMHAIGLLKLKDPTQLNSTQKSSSPVLKSLLSNKFRQSKVGNHEDNPTQKLKRDFELVYIGQVCLSWEILYWQFKKSQELHDCDSQGCRQYNHVAGEYQQFQVLLQRFIENEPFQKRPRIQSYVENRRVLRSFLQVPALRDDCLKDKKGAREEGGYVISIPMLSEIIRESMRIFWVFLRADKDEANVNADLEDPMDFKFMMDIQTNLQKKEKKLKDLLRSRTCIVKKFQKNQEDHLNRALFYAQIELKLIWRVLNMSRLTRDQLVWCHRKLEEINFVNWKICIEPSFLLFPF